MAHFDDTRFRWIGHPVTRKENTRLLRGEGRFTDDFNAPDQLYAAMVRSPYPNARFALSGKRQAQALPGAIGIVAGQDCHSHKLRPIAHNPLPSTRFDLKLAGANGAIFEGPHHLLPLEQARHVGEAIAMTVATSREAAKDTKPASPRLPLTCYTSISHTKGFRTPREFAHQGSSHTKGVRTPREFAHQGAGDYETVFEKNQ